MNVMAMNSTSAATTTADKPVDLQQGFVKHLKLLANKITLAYTIYNERRALLKISDHTLADMGITRADLIAECKRSVFDIPENRK